MYCPNCFSNSLKLLPHGVLTIVLNGRQLSSSHCLFNIYKQEAKDLENTISEKLTDFFIWYKDLKNAGPIKKVEIYSSDFSCENGCLLNPKFKHSVVNILFPQERLIQILSDLGAEYNVLIDLEDDIISESKQEKA